MSSSNPAKRIFATTSSRTSTAAPYHNKSSKGTGANAVLMAGISTVPRATTGADHATRAFRHQQQGCQSVLIAKNETSKKSRLPPPSKRISLHSSRNFSTHAITTNASQASVLPPPPPSTTLANDDDDPPPPLLLEGDNYYFSEDGIARTLYRSDDSTLSTPISIEEVYDIPNSQKRFILRHRTSNGHHMHHSHNLHHPLSSSRQAIPTTNNTIVQGFIDLGQRCTTSGGSSSVVELKEVHDGVLAGVGTGSTTWESSIVMSMVFAANPKYLKGHILELGSGVGLGGILTAFGPYSHLSTEMKSMTLTDHSAEVLKRCQSNIETVKQQQELADLCIDTRTPIKVQKLDWYDFLHHQTQTSTTTKEHNSCKKYDTIIACDCAYMYPDIEALVKTMISLLDFDIPEARVHIFGPNNRGGLHELVTQLRETELFQIDTQSVNMTRYRIISNTKKTTSSSSSMLSPLLVGGFGNGAVGGEEELDSPYASKWDGTYLHITCIPCCEGDNDRSSSGVISMMELD